LKELLCVLTLDNSKAEEQSSCKHHLELKTFNCKHSIAILFATTAESQASHNQFVLFQYIYVSIFSF
jgi:hypothetical protein